jgi:DNA gyrase subunit B
MSEDIYDSGQIQVLSGMDSVRKRPGMYFGTTDAAAIEHFIYELVSNSLDCYLAGMATFVSVEIEEDLITVIDDGPGLPFDLPSDTQGVSLATQLLTTLHHTGSSDGHAPHVHLRYIHGVGLAVLNAASSHLKIQTWRDGVRWEQRFSAGLSLGEPTIIERGKKRGTKIEVIPDRSLFLTIRPRTDTVRQYLFEAAHLVRGSKISYHQEQFHAPQGLVQLIPSLQLDPYDHPYPQPFQLTIESDRVLIDVVADGKSTLLNQPKIYSWVNGGISPAGGSHVQGFLKALDLVNWQPVLVMIHVMMFDPEFAGPTKSQLCVPRISEIVFSALQEPLKRYVS